MSARKKGGRREHHEEHPDERWLLTYADMITLLMALFMVLFSISSVNTSKFESLQRSLQDAFSGRIMPGGEAIKETGGDPSSKQVSSAPPFPSLKPALLQGTQGASKGDAEAEEQSLNQVKERLESFAASKEISDKVKVTLDARGLKISLLTDKLLFASGSGDLQPAAAPLMHKLAGVLKHESNPPHAIRVEGHTDSRPVSGRYPSNWELSTARASAVVRALERGKVASARMEPAGRAYLDPAGSNATEPGRAKNRRVDIFLPRNQNTTRIPDPHTDPVKSKLKIIIPVVLLLVGVAYKTVLAKEPHVEKPKVEGEVYVLPKDFLVNLADGRFAKLGVGLVFEHGYTSVPEAGGHGAAPKPPEGFGVLAQEALVRDIVTDMLTDAEAEDLTNRRGRKELKEKVLKKLRKATDVKVEEVLFTDVAVQ